MCTACRSSLLFLERQAAVKDAVAQMHAAGLAPTPLTGFLGRYGARRDAGSATEAPLYPPAQQRALEAYSVASRPRGVCTH
jgi:hypothetical protein